MDLESAISCLSKARLADWHVSDSCLSDMRTQLPSEGEEAQTPLHGAMAAFASGTCLTDRHV